MFWKRKQEVIHGGLGLLSKIPTPPKKQFATMLEILKDAEKYDNEGEKELSNKMLINLCEYINKFIDI